MPADPAELARRLGAATPADTVRGMIFNGSLEAVRQVAGQEGIDACLAKIERTKFIDFLSYPVADYLKLAWAMVDLLEPSAGGVDASFYKIGYQSVGRFLDSPVGGTLVRMVSGHPRRMLNSAPTAYKTAVSYGDRSVLWPSERHCRLIFKRDFLVPPFHEGVLTMAVEALGGGKVKAAGRQTGPLDAEYDVTWE